MNYIILFIDCSLKLSIIELCGGLWQWQVYWVEPAIHLPRGSTTRWWIMWHRSKKQIWHRQWFEPIWAHNRWSDQGEWATNHWSMIFSTGRRIRSITLSPYARSGGRICWKVRKLLHKEAHFRLSFWPISRMATLTDPSDLVESTPIMNEKWI